MATLLTHVNNTLRLIGEQPLLNTTGNLGDLTKQALEEALYSVIQETRHSSFQQMLSFNVTQVDHLLPAFVLPTRVAQVQGVYLQYGTAPNLRLLKLTPGSLETLSTNWRWCVVGSDVFVGASVNRPATLRLKALVVPPLPSVDSGVLTIVDEAATVMEAVAAAVLASSYLDDLAVVSSLQNRAEQLVTRLRSRAGAFREQINFRGN